MTTLTLTNNDIDTILHALRTSYLDYDDRLGWSYNDAIKRANDELDNLIIKIKEQIKEQEA